MRCPFCSCDICPNCIKSHPDPGTAPGSWEKPPVYPTGFTDPTERAKSGLLGGLLTPGPGKGIETQSGEQGGEDGVNPLVVLLPTGGGRRREGRAGRGERRGDGGGGVEGKELAVVTLPVA